MIDSKNNLDDPENSNKRAKIRPFTSIVGWAQIESVQVIPTIIPRSNKDVSVLGLKLLVKNKSSDVAYLDQTFSLEDIISLMHTWVTLFNKHSDYISNSTLQFKTVTSSKTDTLKMLGETIDSLRKIEAFLDAKFAPDASPASQVAPDSQEAGS